MLNKIKSVIDILGSVACICICGVLLVGLVDYSKATRSGVGPSQAVVKLGLRVGDQYPSLQGFDFRQHKASILLFLSSTCMHCMQSTPTYAHLEEMAAKRPYGSVALVEVLASGKAEVEEFRAHGLSIPAIESVSFPKYGISSTPTIIVVDEKGQVANFWIGELSSKALGELTQIIESAS